jgi:hypothetical protein
VAACAALALGSAQHAAQAAPPPTPATTSPSAGPAAPVSAGPGSVADPDRMLGSGWRTGTDRVVTTASDETGLHLLVADRSSAYQWRTAATLAEPGIDTDQWIGQFCVTGSQRRAVVVYAPRQFANDAGAMTAGAFAAVVDLDTGAVRKLPVRVSLAYYDPACGAGETATLSRFEGTDQHPATWMTVVDTTTGKLSHTVRAAGQLTSPTYGGGTLLAATGTGLVRVRPDGRTSPAAVTTGTPYRILPDGAGAVAFQLQDQKQTVFERYASGRLSRIGAAPTGSLRLHSGSGGRVFVVGDTTKMRWSGARPTGWGTVSAPVGSDVSSTGGLVVTSAASRTEAAATTSGAGVVGRADPVHIAAQLTGGALVQFGIVPAASTAGIAPSPALASSGPASPGATTAPSLAPSTVDASTVPYDPDRSCAVPRNDPNLQTYQPSPKQVEWAADLAAHGELTVSRAAGWLNDGLPAFAPQTLFKPVALNRPAGTSNVVPAQVLLGVLAQESNLREASWHIVDGSSGNPLTSTLGFYGLNGSGDPNSIHTTTADCGYGIGQITTGMRTVDTNTAGGLTDLQQKAVAIDYATNIAAVASMLEQKWNELRAAGIVANDGDPQYIENWFFAVWDYNTGLHANTGSGPWGLGWLNNPANPVYPADRQPYLTAPLNDATHHDTIAYDNAKHPSDWSYPERIMGWARTSVILPDYADNGTWKSTYRTGKWPGDPAAAGLDMFRTAQPGHDVACVASVNYCDPAAAPHKSTDPTYSTEPAGPCQQNDLTQCWWHASATWATCALECGVEDRAYTAGAAAPTAQNIYHEQCSVVGLPTGAKIVDDISTTKALGPDGCAPVAAGGQFTLKFAAGAGPGGTTVYPSKVDFHQAGGGFGGHFWFAHTQQQSRSTLAVTGTWTPSTRFNGWVQVMVHLPINGSWTQQAHYVIDTGSGARDRYLPTNRLANTWIQLGTYHFTGTGPQDVKLSNVTADGQGNQDIAWDAAAFVPLTAKPANFVVAMGDSYESGEGVGNYYRETDYDYGDPYWNACRRSVNAWPRLTTLPGQSSSVGTLADRFDSSVDFQFVACSGAMASDMGGGKDTSYWTTPASMAALHEEADGQFFEKDQLDSGVLSDDTTLVLLSAGGNDANFPETISDCVKGSCAAGKAAYQKNIDDAQSDISALIYQIHQKAKNARIVLVGYPRIFADYHTDSCAYTTFSSSEMDMFNSLAGVMETDQSATATQDNGVDGAVNFVDMLDGFGDHGTCRLYDTNHDVIVSEDINGVVLGPTGPGDFKKLSGDTGNTPCFGWTEFGLNACASRSSFHPKDTGAVRYAQVVSSNLAAMGYHGS